MNNLKGKKKVFFFKLIFNHNLAHIALFCVYGASLEMKGSAIEVRNILLNHTGYDLSSWDKVLNTWICSSYETMLANKELGMNDVVARHIVSDNNKKFE